MKIDGIEVINLRYEIPKEKRTAYASALLWTDSLESLGREAAGYVDQGYRRVKMRLGKDEDYDVAAVRVVRQAVGPAVDVIVDASMRYSLEVARRMAAVLEENRVFWYEEPFEPEDIDNYVALRRHCRVPVAAGENEFGLQGFRELLRAGALDVVQPDACRAGGISECFRVGQLAQKHGARVATHTWSDALALTANMHVIAALPNGITVEVDRTSNPFIDDLLVEPHRIEDGCFRLPKAPGLGVDLNEAVIRRWTMPAGQRLPIGAYSDMSFGKVTESLSSPPWTCMPMSPRAWSVRPPGWWPLPTIPTTTPSAPGSGPPDCCSDCFEAGRGPSPPWPRSPC